MKIILLHSVFQIVLICQSGYGQPSIPINTSQKITHATIRSFSMTQNIMEQEMKMSSSTTVDFDVTIQKKQPTSTHISASVKRLKLTGDAMGKKLDFDSDKKEDLTGEAGSLFKGILTKLIEIDFPQNVMLGSYNKEKKQIPEDDMISSLMGGNFLTELPGEILFVYKISAVGDTLIDKGNFDTQESKKVMQYIVTQLSGNEASLTFFGTELTKKTQNSQGMDVTISGKNKITGEMIVDIKTGIIKQKKTEIEGMGSTEIMSQITPFTTKQTILSKSN